MDCETLEELKYPKAVLIVAGDKVHRLRGTSISASLMRQNSQGKIKILANVVDLYLEGTKVINALAKAVGVSLGKGTRRDKATHLYEELLNMSEAYVQPGVERKKGKLANRVYRRVPEDKVDAEKRDEARRSLPPQARICLELFEEQGVDEVSEADMMRIVDENQDRLRTRQNPWRIFQYYRPRLIQDRFFTLN